MENVVINKYVETTNVVEENAQVPRTRKTL